MPHLSSGELFRRETAAGSQLGRRLGGLIRDGALVPDETTVAVVLARLAAPDCAAGWVLDGFPRNLVQAGALLERHGLDAAVLLEVPDEAPLVRRALARRLCARCGRDHNLLSSPPRATRAPPQASHRPGARADDTAEGIRRRLADYRRWTVPVVDLFRRRGLIAAVDGTLPADEMHRRIRAALGLPPLAQADAAA